MYEPILQRKHHDIHDSTSNEYQEIQ